MSENGKYFNSASENEQWLKTAIDAAIPSPNLVVEKVLWEKYNTSDKFLKEEYAPNYLRLEIDNRIWDVNPRGEIDNGIATGIICEMYTEGYDSVIYFCLKGSLLTCFDSRLSEKHFDHYRFTMKALDDQYPTIVNSVDNMTYLMAYQQFVEGAHLIGHNMEVMNEDGEIIGGNALYHEGDNLDSFLIDTGITIFPKMGKVQLIIAGTEIQ